MDFDFIKYFFFAMAIMTVAGSAGEWLIERENMPTKISCINAHARWDPENRTCVFSNSVPRQPH